MNQSLLSYSRRAALKSVGAGFGYLAFAGLSTLAAQKDNPLAPKPTHFPARAKRVIFLCMEGAPSHVDTFDYKPKLLELDGRTMPQARVFGKLLASPWKFKQSGQSGLWISELFPEVAKLADDLCLLRGMHTDVPAHAQAFNQMHTGTSQFKRPSLGAWALYGLGASNENLPGFVTINPPLQSGGPVNYSNAFLPAVCQGTPIRIGGFGPGGAGFVPPKGSDGGGVSNIKNPKQTTGAQRMQVDLIQSLNREALERDPHNATVEGAIEALELAFRMQTDLPKLMDIANEPAATKALYGIGAQPTDNFGHQCLLARRLVEAGVRFVELTSGQWDHHRDLRNLLGNKAKSVDKPIAGLLKDLKDKGLLKDTLVLWGGEFGRTPYAQGNDGRDHNHRGFTMWMAGGGVKPGFSHGATDDFGYEAVTGKVHVHDWHATILHLLGFDHEKLTYRFAGRDMRLTDLKGNVVKEIIG
jgi:hypothetical protein